VEINQIQTAEGEEILKKDDGKEEEEEWDKEIEPSFNILMLKELKTLDDLRKKYKYNFERAFQGKDNFFKLYVDMNTKLINL